MVKIIFQLVDGSHVLRDLQAKLYGFHQSTSYVLLVGWLTDEKDDNYLGISSTYLLAVSPVM